MLKSLLQYLQISDSALRPTAQNETQILNLNEYHGFSYETRAQVESSK